METKLVTIFRGILKKLEKGVDDKRMKSWNKDLNELIEKYKNIDIPADDETYEIALKLGNEVNTGQNYMNIKMMNRFLPECFYLYYKTTGESKKAIKKIAYSYLISCILFLIVAMPIFPMMISAIFLVPMFIGIRGISKYNSRNIMIGNIVIEMAVFTAFIGVASIISALRKFGVFVQAIATHYKCSMPVAQNLVIVFAVLCIILMATAVYNLIITIKYRKMFA